MVVGEANFLQADMSSRTASTEMWNYRTIFRKMTLTVTWFCISSDHFSIFYHTAFDFNVTLSFAFISILIKLNSGNSRKLSSSKKHHRLLSAQQQTADRYRCIQQRKRDVSLLVETKTEPEGEWIWMLKVGDCCVYICKLAATQNWRLLNDPSSHQSSVVSCLWTQTSFILHFLGCKL